VKGSSTEVTPSSSSAGTSTALRQIETSLKLAVRTRQDNTTFFRKTKWAIRDKKKFDSLITDVCFFVDSLEKLSARWNVLDLQRQLLSSTIQRVTNPESIALLEDAATSRSPVNDGSTSSTAGAQRGSDAGVALSGHEYVGTIIRDRARVVNGNIGIVGPSQSRHRFINTRASGSSRVVQGDMGGKEALEFLK